MDDQTRRLFYHYGETVPAGAVPPGDCFRTGARIEVMPSGAVETPGRMGQGGGKPPWAVPCAERPANPFRLAELLRGLPADSERDVEAAFGMSFDRVIARGGPLYDPDIEKLRANAPQRPAGAPPKSGSAAVPTVTIAKSIGKGPAAPRYELPKAMDASTIFSSVARPLSPTGAGPATAQGTAPFRTLRDPVAILAGLGFTSAQWLATTAGGQIAALYRAGTPLSSVDMWEQWNAVTYAFAATGVGPASGQYAWVRTQPYLETGFAPRVIDPRQGVTGNCFYIASMAGAAWVKPATIQAANWRGGPGPARPGEVTFYMPGAAMPDVVVRADDRYPTTMLLGSADAATGARTSMIGMPFTRPSPSAASYWVSAYEKAMAVWRNAGSQTPDMSNRTSFYVDQATHPAVNIAGGLGNSVILLWRGMDVTWRFITDHCEMSAIGDRRAKAIITPASTESPPGARVAPRHAYTLLGYRLVRGTLGQQQVVLRNPWGQYPPGDPRDNVGTWMGLTLGEDGVGVMNLEPFHNSFEQMTGNWYGPRTEYDFGTDERWDWDA